MLSATFSQGQRVFAPAEPHLGLGLVMERSGRRFTVLFPKTEDRRTYSLDTEALIRFRASPGDTVRDHLGREHKVVNVEAEGDLLLYHTSNGETLRELELSVEVQQPDPFAELALGRPGPPRDFTARQRAHALKALGRSQAQRGLGAARVELLPHQLFVAERVARMWRPRVLLADEVGLGKTVEAGLIAVRLAALGRVESLAVVAPRALVGQWLAEFYRRFARPLTLFDAEWEDELPQDLLIPADDLDFLPQDFSRHLLIVDEAHHYAQEESLVELARRSRAVLFLSATPSLGGEGQLFRLLHILDPMRYPDEHSLQRVGHRWGEVAKLARSIEEGVKQKPLAAELKRLFPEEKDLAGLAAPKHHKELLERLVDRHGLGRSLIRNRRRRLHGLFAGREVQPHQLHAEQSKEQFLVELLKQLAQEQKKALVMVSTPSDVAHWANVLGEQTKLLVARFDESMSLLERDRQAAWFNRTRPDPAEGEGASVLICSEVGGEGRNFQVAHHLVLLDLPRHPDRLEQRIGRLDRIGQTHRVTVHVPLQQEDPEVQVRFHWLDQGLDAFRRPLTEGDSVFQQFESELRRFEQAGPGADFEAWCQQVRVEVEKQEEEAQRAVDPLVDRMSYDPEQAEALKAEVEQAQEELNRVLVGEMAELLDSLGVMMDAQTDKTLHTIKAGDMMFVEALPGLPPGGTQVTLDREAANRRDDVEYLHFEHRLVQGTLDIILDEGVGKATAARWRGAPRTTVLFQMLFQLEAEGPRHLGLDRFLPARVVVIGGDLSGQICLGNNMPGPAPIPESELDKLSPDVVETLLGRTKELRPQIQESALTLLEGQTAALLEAAHKRAEEFFATEEARLEHLKRSEGGSDLYEQARSELSQARADALEALRTVEWRFDAVRMILCQE